jgi:glycosyltransferase involved in cell wall biosynthesis
LHSFFCDKFRSRALRKIASLFERGAGLFVDKIVAPSAYMMRVGSRIYGSEKIALIRNSLSEQLERRLLAVRALRKSRVCGPPYKILFVGRADRQKAVDVLLEAFATVRREIRVTLCVAGVTLAEYVSTYGEPPADLEDVSFIGWVDDTAQLYTDSDVFVIPSRWEAFGLTLLEARMAGVPCVGSNIDAIPELITSKHGVLVEPDSPEQLAAEISKLLHRLPKEQLDDAASDLPTFEEHRQAQFALLASLMH